MAVGSYDANGIWQYGESDNISPFSTTLNKLAASTSSGFTADRARIATLEAGSLSGLIPVKPTAATFVTGTGAVNSLGTVTFSGVSAIDLRGVFTSAFRNYVMVIEGVKNAVAGNDAVYAQFSVAGTRATGANYSSAAAAFLMTDASIQNLGGSGAANVYVARIYQASARFSCQMTFFNPNNAVVTNYSGMAYGTTLGNEQQILIGGGHNLATAYDGIYLFATGNLISGSVTIYGLND